MPRVLAIIPAHNEEATIAGVVSQTKKYVRDVVVIDDGSGDRTAQLARQAGAFVISRVWAGGYGAAQRTGHLYAIREGYNYVIQLDGDAQHNPKYIPKLLRPALSGKYDLVIGSRFLNGSHKKFSFVRRCGIAWFTFVVRHLAKLDITDVTSGYKVFKVSSLKKLERCADMYPAVQQMLEMARKGFKIKEVSVKMTLREHGSSHLNSFKSFFFYPVRMTNIIFTFLIFGGGRK
ncbi:glycosyltransferase family 2 protein [archaeon CG10_big_fil_rev_8_21_14_0_10_43_11]|nr:MAG: glycosyltransferase family 2 protein [archaeon CG10_big_fil_rev_8_21_14_0_10_43_11]